MKKTVSINIGGIIFHIEEDGYEKLKNYLDSVNRYFSTFEDSKEIISDIESRIAEIFLTKLAANRQTLNMEDVDELIATMGTTKDFDATLESEPESVRDESEGHSTQQERTKDEKPKRLYRDTRRKILGGVSAGIAHYFGIDPLWIRLLLIALFINVFFGGLSGATLLTYIILWIVIPANNELEDDSKVKKLFRNPDERVLGGIAGGIAAYFGVDVAIIRLLFVLSIFLGGAGVLIYIILWIITPEARTITEKMQMEGEPVTISNIEESVKRNLKVKEGEEGPLVKILLFPFRLIAIIISGASKLLGPLMRFLVDAVRIIFGAFLSIYGFSSMMIFIFILLTFYGVTGLTSLLDLGEYPVDLIKNSIDAGLVFSAFIFSMITSLAFFLLGLAIILKRRIVKPYIGWSLFALWIMSAILFSFKIPGYIGQFKSSNNFRSEKHFEKTEGVPTLKLGGDLLYGNHLIDLKLRGHEDSVFTLSLEVESRGSSREEAEENARDAKYEVVRDGIDFEFGPSLSFDKDARYRFQHAEAIFYIPYGTVFRMEKDLSKVLVNTLHLNGYRAYQMQDNDWVFNEEGIKCLTCAVDESVPSDKEDAVIHGDEISYPFIDFDEIKVASFFDVDIRKGDEYQVMLRGDDDDLDDVHLNQVGNTLEVKFRDKNWKWWAEKHSKEVDLIITMPELTYLELVGACKGEVSGFSNEEMEVNLVGASELVLRTNTKNLNVELTGASELTVIGSGDTFEAEIIGASKLRAFDFIAKNVSLDVLGASSAHVNASEDLEVDAAGMSTVRYRGDAHVSIDEAGLSSVERD